MCMKLNTFDFCRIFAGGFLHQIDMIYEQDQVVVEFILFGSTFQLDLHACLQCIFDFLELVLLFEEHLTAESVR